MYLKISHENTRTVLADTVEELANTRTELENKRMELADTLEQLANTLQAEANKRTELAKILRLNVILSST